MQRIIQINIAGRVLPIEEDAYTLLKDYIASLERQFGRTEGREIIEDIECRIAELFAIRLQAGSPAIDRSDVQKVIDTLGIASDIHDGQGSYGGGRQGYASAGNSGYYGSGRTQPYTPVRLLRDPFDKVLGGVCSGLAIYFDIDPVIVRLIMALLFFTGIGAVVYIVAWIIIPAARSREELFGMNSGNPISFHDITRNVGDELQDLKKRGEQMSRDLRDFFSKKR